MEGDSSQRWISSALASGLVLGAVGLGLWYTNRQSNNKGKQKKGGNTTQSKGSFSSLYNTTPKAKVSTTANGSNSAAETDNETQDMKGYKTNSKGQKTTYFNRELTENEKKLIGDITPKKIDGSAATAPLACSSPRPVASSPSSGGSAWNKAGEGM